MAYLRFFIGGQRPTGQKSRPKAESGGGVLRGRSKPPPHQLGDLWERCELPYMGFAAEPRPPKGFPPFSACRMVSPDTMILLLWTLMQPLGRKPPCPTPCVRPWIRVPDSFFDPARITQKLTSSPLVPPPARKISLNFVQNYCSQLAVTHHSADIAIYTHLHEV